MAAAAPIRHFLALFKNSVQLCGTYQTNTTAHENELQKFIIAARFLHSIINNLMRHI